MVRIALLLLVLVRGAAHASETCEESLQRQAQAQAERLWSLVLEARTANGALEKHVAATKPGADWPDVKQFGLLQKKCPRLFDPTSDPCTKQERAALEKLRSVAKRLEKEHATLLETRPPASLGVYKSPNGIWACPAAAASFDEQGRASCAGAKHVFAHQLEPHPSLDGFLNAITRGMPTDKKQRSRTGRRTCRRRSCSRRRRR